MLIIVEIIRINVYATMGNGIFSGVGGTSQIINAENYIYNRYVSGTQREIWLWELMENKYFSLHGVKQTVRMISFGIVVLTEGTVHGVYCRQ